MSQTLDQKRAALAWGYAKEGMAQESRKAREYKSFAKGAPALIMSSGLMPTLAFYSHKGGSAERLLDHLIRGLFERLAGKRIEPNQGVALFENFMETLHSCSSQEYVRYTGEALEILKWIRQFVDAVEG